VFPSNGIQVLQDSVANDVTLADFNGDGKLDMAVVYVLAPGTWDYSTNGNVGIFLGDGHGGFTAASGSPFAVGNNPWSIVTGDFNRDGKLDIAVCNDGAANHLPDSITILLGDGHGGFTPAPGSPIALPPNTGPLALAVADFNRDGKLDLVSANLHNNTVSAFLGNGDGTFTIAAGSPISVPIRPWSVVVADFNGDGKPDIALGSYDGGVAVLLGNGNGGFTPAPGSPIQAGQMPERLAIGDFNGDGKPDLAVANWAIVTGGREYGNVTVLLGNGDGTFRPSNNGSFQVGTDVCCVAVADFNQDGKSDIAALSFDGGIASVLLGDGSGRFTPAPGSPFTMAGLMNGIAVGDIDGDGTPDLVASSGTMLLNQSKAPVLQVGQSHTGNFTQGQIGSYTVAVSNLTGSGPTRGTVTVTETVPTGLTLISLTGTGWSCGANSCTRADTLTNGVSYPPLTVTVRVTLGAPVQVTNLVSVSSGGAATVTASDITIINPAQQSIIFLAIAPRTYGAPSFLTGAFATSFLPVTLTSTTSPVCIVSGIGVTIVGAGTCSITATQSGNSVYAAAQPVTQTFVVSKAPLTVTADPTYIVYGMRPPYAATFTGFVNGDSAAVLIGSPAFSTNANTTNGLPNAGAWNIAVTAGTLSSGNYVFNFASGTLTVTKAILTITADAKTMPYGAAVPPLTAAASGFVNGDTSSAVTGAASLATTATSGSVVASYAITIGAGTLAATNYTFTLSGGMLTITKASTAIVLRLVGATLSATVAVTPPGAGAPTGTIRFLNGANILGEPPLAGLTASWAVPAEGGYFSAVYSGDASFTGSTSNAFYYYPLGGSSITLTSSVNPSTLGQAVTFTASLGTTGGPPTATPSGTVQFSDGANLLGSARIASGQATFTTSSLTGGVRTIVAQYSGDSNFGPSQASSQQTVLAPVTMNVTASPAAPIFGQTITLSAIVTASVPAGFAAPSGAVTFQQAAGSLFGQNTTLAVATLSSGVARGTINNLAAGTYTIIAGYGGDATWPSLSRTITITVLPAASATTVSLAINSTAQAVLTAMVTAPAPGNGGATGNVQFVDTLTNAVVGSATLSGGSAAITAPRSAYARPIVAVYSGDANFKGSTSAPLPAVINAAGAPVADFAPDEVVSLFGVTGIDGDTAANAPFPSSLAGVTVKITDSTGVSRLAQLYGVFGSAGQINFVIPSGSASGVASATITLPGGATLGTVLEIGNAAAGIFTAAMNGQGVFAGQILYVHPDGTQTIVNAAAESPAGQPYLPAMLDLSTTGDQVFLVLYGTGIRHAASLTASANGLSVPVAFFGAQGQYPGLDQINLGPLPLALTGAGQINIAITADGQSANGVTTASR